MLQRKAMSGGHNGSPSAEGVVIKPAWERSSWPLPLWMFPNAKDIREEGFLHRNSFIFRGFQHARLETVTLCGGFSDRIDLTPSKKAPNLRELMVLWSPAGWDPLGADQWSALLADIGGFCNAYALKFWTHPSVTEGVMRMALTLETLKHKEKLDVACSSRVGHGPRSITLLVHRFGRTAEEAAKLATSYGWEVLDT